MLVEPEKTNVRGRWLPESCRGEEPEDNLEVVLEETWETTGKLGSSQEL